MWVYPSLVSAALTAQQPQQRERKARSVEGDCTGRRFAMQLSGHDVALLVGYAHCTVGPTCSSCCRLVAPIFKLSVIALLLTVPLFCCCTFAVVSALAAAGLPALVMARGHRIEQVRWA